MKPAAFFDLDRTVLRIDSGTSYMRFQRMRGALSGLGWAKVLWWALQYRFALLDVEELAERLILDYEGDAEHEMIDRCRVWFEAYVEPAITADGRRAIQRHRDLGHEIVLLTGSTQYIAMVVAEALDVEHTLCTRVHVHDGRFTGQFEQICFGHNKVRIAEAWAADHGIALEDSVFYSDSYNDLPMLRRVGTAVAVNPDTRLARHARGAGWRVEKWA